MSIEEERFQEGVKYGRQQVSAELIKLQTELDTQRMKTASTEERVRHLENQLRLAGINVVKFAGLNKKITRYKGSEDIYNPATVVDLINDVLVVIDQTFKSMKMKLLARAPRKRKKKVVQSTEKLKEVKGDE